MRENSARTRERKLDPDRAAVHPLIPQPYICAPLMFRGLLAPIQGRRIAVVGPGPVWAPLLRMVPPPWSCPSRMPGIVVTDQPIRPDTRLDGHRPSPMTRGSTLDRSRGSSRLTAGASYEGLCWSGSCTGVSRARQTGVPKLAWFTLGGPISRRCWGIGVAAADGVGGAAPPLVRRTGDRQQLLRPELNDVRGSGSRVPGFGRRRHEPLH